METRWMRIGIISVIFLVTGLFFIIFRFVWMDQTIRGMIGDSVRSIEEPTDQLHMVAIASGSMGDYWPEVFRGATEASKLYQVDLELVRTGQADPNEMARMIEKYTAAQVDVILVEGKRDTRFLQTVRRAKEANIQLLTIDADSNPSLRDGYVGPNHFGSGQVLAKRLMESVADNDAIAVIQSDLTSIKQSERLRGMKDVLGRQPILFIEDRLDQPGALHVSERATELLRKYPSIKAMITLDENEVKGIAKAVRLSGKPNLAIFGFESSELVVDWIRNQQVEAVIRTPAYQTGFDAIRLADELTKGKTKSNVIEMKGVLTDRSTLSRSKEVAP